MILEMETLEDFVDELRYHQVAIIDRTVRFSAWAAQRNVATADWQVSAMAMFKTRDGLVLLMTWGAACGVNAEGQQLAQAAAEDMKKVCDELELKLRPGKMRFPKDGG